MQAVCVDTPGGTENMCLKSVPRPQPKAGEALVKIHATALNRADLLQVFGTLFTALLMCCYWSFSLMPEKWKLTLR